MDCTANTHQQPTKIEFFFVFLVCFGPFCTQQRTEAQEKTLAANEMDITAVYCQLFSIYICLDDIRYHNGNF